MALVRGGEGNGREGKAVALTFERESNTIENSLRLIDAVPAGEAGRRKERQAVPRVGEVPDRDNDMPV